MNQPDLTLLKQNLAKAGYRENQLTFDQMGATKVDQIGGKYSAMIVPSSDGKVVSVLSHFYPIDPSRHSNVLALALNLNLSTVHTMASSIALDIDKHELCLRFLFDMYSHGERTFDVAMMQHWELIDRLKDIIDSFLGSLGDTGNRAPDRVLNPALFG